MRTKKILLSGLLVLSVALMSANVKALESTDLKIGDTSITQNVIDVGNEYARKMEEQSRMKRMRMDEEVWKLTSSKVVIPFNTLSVKHGDFIPAGESRSKTCSWNLGVNQPIGNTGIELNVGVSGSVHIEKSGPSNSDKLPNKLKATHRSFFAIGQGKVVTYTYKVTKKYSGEFIRYETVTQAADVRTLSCSQLVNINGSSLTAENSNATKVKKTTTSNYLAQMRKTGAAADDYYYF